jgi:hypothetical protein
MKFLSRIIRWQVCLLLGKSILANKDKAANDMQIIFINRTVYKSVQSSEYDAGRTM